MYEKQRKDFSNVIERKATHAPYFKGIFEAAHEEIVLPNDEQILKNKKF